MANKDDYLTEYRQFFEEFANTVEPNDQLPVKLGSYKFINSEVVGGIVDWCLQYLNRKSCPSTLVGPLIKITIDEIRMACKKHPVACGFNPNENVYEPLKLMQTVMSKVNEVCLRYLDNAQLDTLPSPPTVAPPPVSMCASRNTRRRMEDRHVVIHDINGMFNIPDTSPTSYYAIFDGHAGPDAASYSAAHLHQFLVESEFYPTDPERALKEAFLRTDEFFLEKSKIENFRSGTTAVCALLRPKEETLYVAWVGDSQALLVNRGKVLQIVKPHKPCREDEKDRIEANGGCVMFWGMWRVNGQLAVSRAIGDLKLKPYVTAEPDIVAVPLDGNEEFLIIACDGLWDFVSEDDAAIAVYKRIKENPDNIDTIAESLSDLAKQEGSRDNISIIIIFLKDPSKIAKKISTDWGWPSVQTPDVTMETGVDNTNINNTASNNAFDLFDVFQKRGLDHFATEQPEFNKSNGTDTKGELYLYDRPANGKRRADDEFDEEEDDFGPETDVDGVDDVLLSPMMASGKALEKVVEGNGNNNDSLEKMDTLDVDLELQRQQSSEYEPLREPREETPTPPADSVLDSSGLADNVAESEDSEDEWNYYRVDPKQKESSVPPLETNNKVSPGTPPHDDMSQLNPDAKEFVPVSPTRTAVSPAPYTRDLVDDALIAQSPRRAVPMDISVPSANEFQLEVKQRPSELFDDEFEADNTQNQNGHQLSSQEIMQNLLNGKDVSEIEFHPSNYVKPVNDNYFGNNLGNNLIENETENSKENISPSEEHPTESSLSPMRDESDFANFVPKPQDPMSMSFYQDKDEEVGFSTNPFDLNKVQLLPENVDEFIQPTSEPETAKTPLEVEISPAQSPLGVPLEAFSPVQSQEESAKSPEPSEVSETKSPVPNDAISPAECMISKSPLLEVSRSPLPDESKSPLLEETKSPVPEVCELSSKTPELCELPSKSPLLEVDVQENKSLMEIANSPVFGKSPSPLCEISESPVCEIAKSPFGDISESPVCEIAKSASPVCEIAKSPLGEISQSPVCEIAKSPFGDISESPVCDIAKSASPVCEIAKSPFGEISQSPVCEIAKSPFGNVSESPVCEIAKSASPVCEISQSPVCEIAKSPIGDVSESPVCEISKSASPVCEISQSPVCEIAKSPICEISQSPVCDIAKSASPVCDIAKSASPVCEISQSPVCEIAKSPLLEAAKTPEISQSPIPEISQPPVCEIPKSPILDVHSPMELSSPVGPLSPKSPIPELTGLVSPDITASIKDENISGEICETPKSPALDDVLKSPLQELVTEVAKSPVVEIERILSPVAKSPFVEETKSELKEATNLLNQFSDDVQNKIDKIRAETPKSPLELTKEFEEQIKDIINDNEVTSEAQAVMNDALQSVTNEMENLIDACTKQEITEPENINISMASEAAPSEVINSFLERSVVPEVTSPLSPVDEQEKFQTERPESWKENLEIKCETIKPEFAIHTMTSPSADTPPPPPTPAVVIEEPELKRGSPEPEKIVEAVEKLGTVKAKIAGTKSAPKTTTTATTKKPLTSKTSPTSPSKPLPSKTTTTTLKKTPTPKSSPAPKQLTPRAAAKPLTPTASPRTTSTTRTAPKPATPSTTTTRTTPKPAEKKPLTNGDVKPAARTSLLKKTTTTTSTVSKTASATSTASAAAKLSPTKSAARPSSVGAAKPAAPRTTTAAKSATAGTVPKPRPASLTAKTTTTTSAATTKTATSRPATTGTTRPTTTTTARPKPTTTTLAARPRPTAAARPSTKAPDTEKQIKETANKQLSAARTTTSRTTTAAAAAKTTSTATRKLDTKTAVTSRTTRTTTTTLKSTTKKPTEVTKTTITKTKTAVAKPAAEQNGVVNVIQEITTTIVSDDPQLLKDNSPVENIEIDNSKLAEIIAD